MFNHLSITRKSLTTAALLAAALFTVGNASAGTTRPVWLQEREAAEAANTPEPVAYTSVTVVEEEAEGQALEAVNAVEETPEECAGEEHEEDNTILVNGGGDNDGDDSGAVAAPTPSAVAGGLAMLGLMAGRRRKAAQAQD